MFFLQQCTNKQKSSILQFITELISFQKAENSVYQRTDDLLGIIVNHGILVVKYEK